MFWLDGKKISGMLLEASPAKKGVIDWLVIGIGVNVNYYPENTMYPLHIAAGDACTN